MITTRGLRADTKKGDGELPSFDDGFNFVFGDLNRFDTGAIVPIKDIFRGTIKARQIASGAMWIYALLGISADTDTATKAERVSVVPMPLVIGTAWLFELGPEALIFNESWSMTKYLKNDAQGVKTAKESLYKDIDRQMSELNKVEAFKGWSSVSEHYDFGPKQFINENTLAGHFLGSYDIRAFSWFAGSRNKALSLSLFAVENTTSWASATRLPWSRKKSMIERRRRGEGGFGRTYDLGGDLTQIYFWSETNDHNVGGK